VPGSPSTRRRIAAVLAGGFCGTITRSLLSTLIQSYAGKGWPFDILLINLTGALLFAFVTVLADATFLIGPTRRLFITIGFLGAYTTFSSLALGDVLLFAANWWPALLYLLASFVGGLLAILLGDWLGQWCISRLRREQRHAKQTRKLSEVPLPLPSQDLMRTGHHDVHSERNDPPSH
jgi:protein CrcB